MNKINQIDIYYNFEGVIYLASTTCVTKFYFKGNSMNNFINYSTDMNIKFE